MNRSEDNETPVYSIILMNAEKYLTTKQIWIELTSEIRDLDGESIVIIDSEERETPAYLRVSQADPNGTDAGKCSVEVCVVRSDKVEWGNASPPTTETGGFERFLTQDAVDLIRPNNGDLAQGNLILELPVTIEFES